MDIEKRKTQHIELCIKQNVESGDTWFDKVKLIPSSLPEMNYNNIETSTEFFDKKLEFPLIIGAMTGGTETGKRINRALAETAEKYNIGFGLGSQRAMMVNPSLTDTYKVRDVAPNALILGNIGVVQAREYSNKELKEMLNDVGADALCIHINAAQEIFQKNGDINFELGLKAISRISKELPVIAKSVGQGMDRDTAIRLQSARVKAINIAGTGGTNWIKIDGALAKRDYSTFENWGIPTSASLIECGKTVPLISSGGIRTGLEMAKSIAMGASVCSMALPFLKAWKTNSLDKFVQNIERDFKTAMYLCGCKNINELKKVEYTLFDELLQYADQRINYQQNIK